ncbi:MAG: aldo/keto reductase [Acidobacteriaceae bacterium]
MNIEKLALPLMALGTWAWGDSGELGNGYFGSDFSEEGLRDVVEKAHAVGLYLWDTAVVYGMGRSEALLGDLLKHYSRDEYQLSTKFTPQAAGSGDHPVADMLEQSLSRLGTDHIDIYWIHNPADVTRWTPQLIPLLESGRIKHVGVSNHNLSEIALANKILGEAGFHVEAVQNHYSLLYRKPEDAGILDYCRSQGIPFFAYMVLEQGALSGKYSPENPLPEGSNRAQVYNSKLPQLKMVTDMLSSIGRSKNATASDVTVAWSLAKGVVPIIGVTKPSHIDGLIQASVMKLSSNEIEELEAIADAAKVDTRGWWEKEI